MAVIKFHVPKSEASLINRIVMRAFREGLTRDSHSTNMDLTACHANGTKLDLERLLYAHHDDFAHDVAGISGHLDRTTGKLIDLFSPRTSMPSCPTCYETQDIHIDENLDQYLCQTCAATFPRCNPATDSRCQPQIAAKKRINALKPGPNMD